MHKIINCVVCNKEMVAINGDQLRRKFCSNKCRNWYNNRNNKGKQNFCEDCGNQINIRSKYCRKCMIKHRDFWDEKNPRYNKGTSAGYLKRLADESVIKSGRRGDLCERCGVEETNPRKIQPHHIDKNRTNNNPENLKVLCKSCHIKTHYRDYKVERQCKNCGNNFMSSSSRHIFCSKKCVSLTYYRTNKQKLRKNWNGWYKNKKQGEL